MNRSGTAILVLSAFWNAAQAGVLHPQGLYYHAFTGSVDGSEWTTVGSLPGNNRYEIADFPAHGVYPGTITDEGQLILDNGRGTGLFRPDNTASIDFTLGQNTNFHSELRRAPHTDERFPVFMTEARSGDSALGGVWQAHTSAIDPVTGDTLIAFDQSVTITIDATTVRVTAADGSYHQGVWLADDQAGFRVITPNPSLTRYRSFPGSATSATLNMVGELRVQDENHMTVALFFQSRSGLGTQVQSMQFMELTRVPNPATLALPALALATARRRR